jgi:Na+/H+ antiporter NhaC
MKDKFRTNLFIALPAAIVAMVLYGIVGGQGSGAVEVGAYNPILVLPYIIVLVTALTFSSRFVRSFLVFGYKLTIF